MRYIVRYRKEGQIEGARLFDIPRNATPEAIQEAAESTAGHGAVIVEVRKNDGSTDLHERKANA
jgi:hypothetical protein